jgi:uncharacterized membrane protein
MNMSFNGADFAWVVIAGTMSVLVSMLWLYIAWRAMRAHELLAAAADQIARNDTKNFAAAIANRSAANAVLPQRNG